jgi:hypothetical protein
MKNSATLGFRISTMESSSARFTVFGGATGWSGEPMRERIMPMPSNQVERARDLHGHVEFRHMFEYGRKPEGGGEDMQVAAKMDAEHRHQSGLGHG